MDTKAIGNRIHLLIKENAITAKELAQNTGIKESALTGYKKGEYAPSAEAIINISEFFNITADWLLKGENSKSTSAIINNNNDKRKLSKEEYELLRIYNSLDVKRRCKLISNAFSLEEEMIKE